jgi:hypothetical protein
VDYADRLRSFGEAVKRQSLLGEKNHVANNRQQGCRDVHPTKKKSERLEPSSQPKTIRIAISFGINPERESHSLKLGDGNEVGTWDLR